MSEDKDLIDNIFDEEYLRQMHEEAPTEGGEGLVRKYKLHIESAYFQEAPDEYKAKVDRSANRVGQDILAVFEGYDVESGEQRKEKYSIGQGFNLDGGDGKTASRICPAGSYSKISGNSLYGRLYNEMTGHWGVSEEDLKSGKWDITIGVDKDGKKTVVRLGPDGRKFYAHVSKKFKRAPSPMDIRNFEGITLQMDAEEWTDREKKVRVRTFPVGIVDVSDLQGSGQSNPPKKQEAPSSSGSSSNSSSVEEVNHAPENWMSDEEMVVELTALAAENEFAAYSKEAMAKIKANIPVSSTKKWISHVVQKKNYEAFKAGEGKAP